MAKLLLPKEAAEYCRCSVAQLTKLRIRGGGPVYTKATGRILYDTADLDRWITANKRRSTADSPRRPPGRPRTAATA